MKLLSKNEAQSSLRKDNDELLETNLRLRQFERNVVGKLNTIKETYEPEKLAKLKEFEQFCKELAVKRSKLLQELAGIEQEIVKKKEIYYGLIAKQDALDEKIFNLHEQESKLKLREAFVVDLEQKWRNKNQ